MTEVWDWVKPHHVVIALGVFWVASNIVTALPSPTNESGNLYKTVFAASHSMIGALPRIFPALRAVFGDPTASSGTYFAKPNTQADTTPTPSTQTPTGGQ